MLVHAPGNRIVRKTAVERDRQNAWTRGKKQTFREYVAQTAVAGLRSEPVHDWLSLHRRLAEDGLYLSQMDGKFLVMDGWDRNREGVQLDSFGPSWCAEKLMKKMGDYTPVPKDIFSQVEAPGRYNPDFIAADVRRKKSLKQKVCSSMPVVILENVCRKWHGKDGWKTARLFTAHWLKRDYGCVFSMVTWLSVTVMIITRLPFVLTAYGRC